jgi:hypothetical protein
MRFKAIRLYIPNVDISLIPVGNLLQNKTGYPIFRCKKWKITHKNPSDPSHDITELFLLQGLFTFSDAYTRHYTQSKTDFTGFKIDSSHNLCQNVVKILI